MARQLLCVLLMMIMSSMAWATIYKSVDVEGNVKYSDQPSPGATKVVLPAGVIDNSGASPSGRNYQAPPPPQAATATEYKGVQIIMPQDGTTLRDNSGNMTVAVAIQPNLRNDDKIQLMMDGNAIGQPQRATNFQLSNVNRGEHKLMAQVVSAQGKVLVKSPEITFFMHQAHLNPGGGITS